MNNKMPLFDRTARMIWPSHCICCDEIIAHDSYICDDCRAELKKLKKNGARTISYYGRKMSIHSVFEYSGSAKSAILMLKFGSRPDIAVPLGIAVAEKAKRMRCDGFDEVCFVPMTSRAIRLRGYNQSERIAKSAAKRMRLPLNRKGLLKVRENMQQHNLTGRDRRENVRGVFAAGRGVRGKRILLVDDISTTGSTLCECAQVLMLAGARSVCLFSVAATKYSN
jgi:competence protein ComFC